MIEEEDWGATGGAFAVSVAGAAVAATEGAAPWVSAAGDSGTGEAGSLATDPVEGTVRTAVRVGWDDGRSSAPLVEAFGVLGAFGALGGFGGAVGVGNTRLYCSRTSGLTSQ